MKNVWDFPMAESLQKNFLSYALFDSSSVPTQSRSSFGVLRKAAEYLWQFMIDLNLDNW